MRFVLAALICVIPVFGWAGSGKNVDFSKPNVKVFESEEAKKYDGGSKHVKVFMVIDRIFNIDISAGTYEVEAELLLKWRNDEDIEKIRSEFKEHTYAGEKMEKIIDKIWHPEFIVKSELHRRETLFSTIHLNKDGSLELFEKFETILPINTDIREYPFGTLQLNLDIVAFTHDAHEMVFDPIHFELGHPEQDTPVVVGNWTLTDYYIDKKIAHRLSTTDQVFTQNGFHFIIKHDFNDTLQKIFFPLGGVILISIFLNLFSSMQFKANYEARVQGQLTLLLTVFALKFTLAGETPQTHYMNFIDMLFMIATGAILINLFSSIAVGELYLSGQNQRAYRYERVLDWACPFFVVAALVLASYSVFT